jgi:hypothetical protein
MKTFLLVYIAKGLMLMPIKISSILFQREEYKKRILSNEMSYSQFNLISNWEIHQSSFKIIEKIRKVNLNQLY